ATIAPAVKRQPFLNRPEYRTAALVPEPVAKNQTGVYNNNFKPLLPCTPYFHLGAKFCKGIITVVNFRVPFGFFVSYGFAFLKVAQCGNRTYMAKLIYTKIKRTVYHIGRAFYVYFA